MSINNTTPYVKFLRGSIDAYNSSNKDSNTLYFVWDDENKITGSLYLGATKISAGSVEDIDLLVDDLSISKKEDGTLFLKNYGQKYYQYIPATETEEGYYDLVEGWLTEGILEPRVENGELVWYEPNPTTVEGLDSRLTDVEKQAKSNTAAITALTNDLDSRIENKIAAEVASLLTLKKVNTYEEIKPELEDANKYLYVVPNNTTGFYDEYVIIDGKVEQVGDTSISLEGYATEDYVDEAIKNLVSVATFNALTEEVNILKSNNETINTSLNNLNVEISGLKDKDIELTNTLNEEIQKLVAADSALSTRITDLESRMQWTDM